MVRLRELVSQEAGERSPARIDRCLLRLSWSGQQASTLTLALRVAHGLITRYRRYVMARDAAPARPIWPLRLYGVGPESEIAAMAGVDLYGGAETEWSIADSDSDAGTIVSSDEEATE